MSLRNPGRFLPLIALSVACTTTPLPAGNLADPVALTAAPSQNQPKGELIFIAEGSGQDLKAFKPGSVPELYVYGPNAITALSIPLQSVLPSNPIPPLPSFRAQRIAAPPPVDLLTNTPYPNPGYVVAAGTANRLAVVDTQTFRTTVSADDDMRCQQKLLSVSCLPVPAFDVAATATQAFALLAPDPALGGAQSIIVMTPTVESGAPVLSYAGTRITLPAGLFTRMAVMSDGSLIYLADSAPFIPVPNTTPPTTGRVVQLDVMAQTTKNILADGPVRVPVITPFFVGAPPLVNYPEGQFILAVLADGRVQTLDPATGTGALTGIGCVANPPPTATAAQPPVTCASPATHLFPMDFGAPAIDIQFIPCPQSPGNACPSTIRYATDSIASVPTAAFVALGDGTAAAISPDQTPPTPPAVAFGSGPVGFSPGPAPQIYRAIQTGPGPSATTPVFTDPNVAATFSMQPVQLVTLPLTLGITKSENVEVTFEGPLPSYSGRSGTLTETATNVFTLTDPGAFAATVLSPAAINDVVRIGDLGTECGEVSGDQLLITAIDPPDTATVEFTADSAANGPMSSLPCIPTRIGYDVLSASVAAGQWTVIGTVNGFMGRTNPGPTTTASPPAPTFTFPTATTPPPGGEPFFYQNNTVGGPSLQFALYFSSATSTNPADQGTNFTFTTASGYLPFTVSSPASTSGLTSGLAALPNTLYMSIVGADSLTEVFVDDFTLANSVNDYR